MANLSEKERKNELALLVQYIIQNTKYKTLNQLAIFLGTSPATIGNWNERRTDPLKMNVATLYKMVVLRGWDTTKYIKYLLGEIEKDQLEEGTRDITNTAINLPLPERAKLARRLLETIEEEVNAYSSTEFVETLKAWLDRENLSIEEGSQLTNIVPQSRFQALVESGLMPNQRELILLTICDRFKKNDGSSFELAELEGLVAGDVRRRG